MNEQILYDRPSFPAQLNMAHPLSRGLVGAWVMNETGGMRVWDSSPYKFHGKMTNFDSPIKRSSINGTYFDGVNNFIDCGTPTQIPIGNSERTFEIWVKDEGGAGANHFALTTAAPSTNESFLIGTNNTTKAIVTTAGMANDLLGSTNDFTKNPMQIVGTYRLGLLSLFVNAQADGTKNITNTNTGTPDTRIGKHASGEYFKGRIYMCRIWNRLLPLMEIKNLYLQPYDMFLK